MFFILSLSLFVSYLGFSFMVQGSKLSTVTSLFLVSRLLQVIGGKDMINYVAVTILYPYMTSSVRKALRGYTAVEISYSNAFLKHLNEMEKMVCSGPECEGEEDISCLSDNVCMERLLGFLL